MGLIRPAAGPAVSPPALLEDIRQECSGMLPLEIYERLYAEATLRAGGTIVEIGTAGGASAIVLALGAKAGGPGTLVYSVDPFDRGSRLTAGTIDENVAQVRKRFSRFGVADEIRLVVGTSDIVDTGQRKIDLLLLDADGRIDRDLAVLFDRIDPDALIVIDDIGGEVLAHYQGTDWLIDQKHRLGRRLCELLCAKDVLIQQDIVGETGFFRKGPVQLSPIDWAELAREAYSELVFARIGTDRIGKVAAIRQRGAQRFPRLVRMRRRLINWFKP